jgi:hypothetical protein
MALRIYTGAEIGESLPAIDGGAGERIHRKVIGDDEKAVLSVFEQSPHHGHSRLI